MIQSFDTRWIWATLRTADGAVPIGHGGPGAERKLRALIDAEIKAYVATGEPMDKAEAYGAQSYASLFVEKLEGDFFNVMGLPLCALGNLLKRLDVSLI